MFVEAENTELTAFIRDTGCGFDPADVGTDRRGISESIVGRVQRLGGTAVLTSCSAARGRSAAWPRAASSPESSPTNAFTSWSSSQGNGVTWAMVRGSGKAQA